jgi:glutamate-1-semialdehyde 2,1-aminomutase
MAAGLAILNELDQNPGIYEQIERSTSAISSGIEGILSELDLDYTVNQIGSMYSLFFTKQRVVDFETAKSSDTAMFGRYFNAMLSEGIYLAPSQYESLFISSEIRQPEIDRILEANRKVLRELHQ